MGGRLNGTVRGGCVERFVTDRLGYRSRALERYWVRACTGVGVALCKAPKRDACLHVSCCKLHWICHGEREVQQGGLEVGMGE